jgi:hypothetical protein
LWPLGSLAVHWSFHIFYFLELPHSVAAVLGLSFLSKQLSILALFLAGALGTSRIVTAALFSFEWIPGALGQALVFTKLCETYHLQRCLYS